MYLRGGGEQLGEGPRLAPELPQAAGFDFDLQAVLVAGGADDEPADLLGLEGGEERREPVALEGLESGQPGGGVVAQGRQMQAVYVGEAALGVWLWGAGPRDMPLRAAFTGWL